MPRVCSCAACRISEITRDTLVTLPTISRMVPPLRSTCSEPALTLLTVDSISVLISLAACELRCASERTSPATTAKPRPCSPARAASTAAFSARILVWNAMPSITPVMSDTLTAACCTSPMVCTAAWIAWPPSSATCLACTEERSAARADASDCPTVAVICSIDAAVCCRLAAADSVRRDRSALPAAISLAAPCTASLASRICRITPTSLSAKALKAPAICATSSLPCAGNRRVRSPSPLPMAAIASRIDDRRRNETAVTAAMISAAASATTTSEITEATSTERMPAVASALSSAITAIQSVPGTAVTPSSLASSPTITSIGVSMPSCAASLAPSRPGISSPIGLSISLSSPYATIWPLRATRMPKLLGVGWIERTFSTTPSIGTLPPTTARRLPSRMIGTANVTTILPVLADT